MQLACSHYRRVLEFSGERPSFCSYCGQPLGQARTAPLDAEAETVAPRDGSGAEGASVPGQVGGYRLLRPLGAGGMGSVYEAEEVATGRRVALKLIAPDFASPEAVERFRREGRLASAILHPRCVFVLAADEEAGRPYIVMELMPGDTLESLVERRGPLPAEEAVARILDVIDGLREAHRLGVIHRDVKPSNCFLDTDGRVKVGDFGLAKSLAGKVHLTRTGSFLGTLLFAAPEQIRGETVDPQSDVYSTAATLYYLFTGRAAFQGNDPAATLARIVADPAPPMRTLRPDLPAALDRVVLLGLERDRAHRWRSLEEFRNALLPFAPGRLSIGGVGLRFGAYLIDALILTPFGFAGAAVAMARIDEDVGPLLYRVLTLESLALLLLYFAVPEGLWGCTLGKRLLRLRVWTVRGNEPPGVARAVGWTLIWFVLTGLPQQIMSLVSDPAERARDPQLAFGLPALQLGLLGAGILLMVCTMRARNGYRCLYDILTGTRVVQLPEPDSWQTLPIPPLDRHLAPAAEGPVRFGAFVVRGQLGGEGSSKVLLAEDPTLTRPVLIWVRPAGAQPLDARRRELGRATRLRCLTGGREADWQWDAFLAPAGCPLPEVAAERGPLAWPEGRLVLEQLTDELAATCADGSLPPTLDIGQVWVQGNGQVVLLDMGVGPAAEGGAGAGSDQERTLALLGQAAILLLEGRPRPAGSPPAPIRAAVPAHAARLLQRLLGVGEPYRHVGQVQADLSDTRDRPRAVTRTRRAAQLAVLAGFLGLGLGCMSLGGCMPALFVEGMDLALVELAERERQNVVSGAYREFTVAAVNPATAVRVAGLVQLDQDLRLADAMEEQRARSEQRHLAHLGSVSPPLGAYLRMVEAIGRPQTRAAAAEYWQRQMPWAALFFRTRASGFDLETGAGAARTVAWVAGLILMAPWPLAWVLWAFLTRGGFSYPAVGLCLARTDGRRAPRWRCAWRALLVWLPVTALLALSIGLEAVYGSIWDPGDPSRWGWMPWVSCLAWWAGWGLLPLYVVVALWAPARVWHDRLAGTCLVPR
jgi:hypothetical protein